MGTVKIDHTLSPIEKLPGNHKYVDSYCVNANLFPVYAFFQTQKYTHGLQLALSSSCILLIGLLAATIPESTCYQVSYTTSENHGYNT